MKNHMGIALVFLSIGLLRPQAGLSQGTLYASNLQNTPRSQSPIASDNWNSISFQTGPDEAGYFLNSIDLLMLPATGAPEGFSLSLYDYDSAGRAPGNRIGGLIGPDPAAGGVFNFTATEMILAPSTLYFILATSSTTEQNGAYIWQTVTRISDNTGGWEIGPYVAFSPDGTTWDRPRSNALQLGVYATVIPEPSTLALIGGGAALLAFRQYRRRKA